nr:MAG TPA: PBCV-1 capsid-measure protein, minor capsid proteins.5A [Caudoviricetes sp.]
MYYIVIRFKCQYVCVKIFTFFSKKNIQLFQKKMFEKGRQNRRITI